MLSFASAFIFVSILRAPVDEEEFAIVSAQLEIAVLEGVFAGPSWGCSFMESLMVPVVVELGVDEEEPVTAPALSEIAVLVSVFTASLAPASL